ncbi:MAG TPA: tripartite tricarboxylate transporter substrate binding protein [Burkholderiales bacterium]|nr:tripartite tricarboxylate transporter substrate binding protein [Burkholderiales bacterium]
MNAESKICVLAAAAVLIATPAAAQNYPVKPVRIIVPYAAGGNTDYTARAVGMKLAEILGQQILVENRPGAGTNIGTELVVKAPADGYTLLMGGAANAINMSLLAKPPYNTVRDLVPVSWCVQGANVLAVHPSLPAKNLKELIALARARPGQLNFASSGIGGSNHMGGELLKVMAKINIVHVPYKGNNPALADAVGGHVEMVIAGVPALQPLIQSGKLRAIAIGSRERFAAIPEVPTFIEAGLPGYESTNWFGLMAPAKTPRDIVTRLSAETDKVLRNPELKSRFHNAGLEAKGGSPEVFGNFIRSEIDKYAKVIQVAGVPRQ